MTITINLTHLLAWIGGIVCVGVVLAPVVYLAILWWVFGR